VVRSDSAKSLDGRILLNGSNSVVADSAAAAAAAGSTCGVDADHGRGVVVGAAELKVHWASEVLVVAGCSLTSVSSERAAPYGGYGAYWCEYSAIRTSA